MYEIFTYLLFFKIFNILDNMLLTVWHDFGIYYKRKP